MGCRGSCTSCSSSGSRSPVASLGQRPGPGLPHSTGRCCCVGARPAPHTSSESKLHPVPAAQPSASSATVQSLAPAAWQMASASEKVLFHAHGQPASDSPHTEQPGRLFMGQDGSAVSEQQRTWPRIGARLSQCMQAQVVGCVGMRAPRAARSDRGALQLRRSSARDCARI